MQQKTSASGPSPGPKGLADESDVKPPNPHGTVTVRRPREDPPVSVHLTADQTRCIHGHLLSDPTETVPRLYEDIVDGNLVGIECRVVRRSAEPAAGRSAQTFRESSPRRGSAST